jgi:hypothetical protein
VCPGALLHSPGDGTQEGGCWDPHPLGRFQFGRDALHSADAYAKVRRDLAHSAVALRQCRTDCRLNGAAFSGRRQPSCDGTSRMMREYHVRNL